MLLGATLMTHGTGTTAFASILNHHRKIERRATQRLSTFSLCSVSLTNRMHVFLQGKTRPLKIKPFPADRNETSCINFLFGGENAWGMI